MAWLSERGGEGFTAWFAEDGVSMSNGAAPLIGKVAIARSAKWDPKEVGPEGLPAYVDADGG
ncbi:hypothetical protein [Terracidiphilus sp.]|uniref:hypothetical protein n=1 Tax=Terracidiphilus sp. TaxID=1964191 RepID=UPI003C1D094F